MNFFTDNTRRETFGIGKLSLKQRVVSEERTFLHMYRMLKDQTILLSGFSSLVSLISLLLLISLYVYGSRTKMNTENLIILRRSVNTTRSDM